MDRSIEPETIHFYQWLDRQRLLGHSGLALGNSSTYRIALSQSYVLMRRIFRVISYLWYR